MLALRRNPGESIYVGKNIKIVVVECNRNYCRIGIEAPDSVSILRGELVDVEGNTMRYEVAYERGRFISRRRVASMHDAEKIKSDQEKLGRKAWIVEIEDGGRRELAGGQ